MTSPTAAVLGEIGLPAPIHELAARKWDAIVVGAGNNGLACAAYLAGGVEQTALQVAQRPGQGPGRVRLRGAEAVPDFGPG
jgi:hypothetical protein